jgi:hypothetical protein
MTNNGAPTSIHGNPRELQQNKTWADLSTKLTTPRSISTAATADRPNISYDPYPSTNVFTKVNIDTPKPTDNI